VARHGFDSKTCSLKAADEFAHVLPHFVDSCVSLSIDFLDRQAAALPRDEAAGNLGCAVSQRCLRSDGVLAEVDRSLSFGIEGMPCE
jgi:hypothetical protein